MNTHKPHEPYSSNERAEYAGWLPQNPYPSTEMIQAKELVKQLELSEKLVSVFTLRKVEARLHRESSSSLLRNTLAYALRQQGFCVHLGKDLEARTKARWPLKDVINATNWGHIFRTESRPLPRMRAWLEGNWNATD